LELGFFSTDKKANNSPRSSFLSHKWLDKKTILFSDFSELSRSQKMNRGFVVQVFEVAGEGQQCFLGLFSFSSRRENGLVFRALRNVSKSNLAAWARSRKIPLSLKWDFPSDVVRSMNTTMPCRSWIEMPLSPDKEIFSFVTEKFFLSSNQFSSVRASNSNTDLRISAHAVRAGWIVQAPVGRHRLIVRHAESGILQSLLIHVERRKKQGARTFPKQIWRRTKAEQLILPGWD
jgi:hypothetical protein